MQRRQQVLVIDDASDIHDLVRVCLNDLAVDVSFAWRGDEGLDAAVRLMPDLILLDLVLPDCDGFDVLAKLKLDPVTREIPVIFISGREEPSSKVKGFDLGAVDYVTKPFEPAELRARVRAALNTKSLMDLLTTRAQIDGLTGLHNRRYFDERLAQELATGRRYHAPLGLLMLDIDHFKSINDSLGHPSGDQVLRNLSNLLRNTCRTSDIPCRYGGEEMAIILPHTGTHDTYKAGVRLLEAIRTSGDLMQILDRPLTASIGAACSMPSDNVTVEQLVAKADSALYRAKSGGRNRVAAAFGVENAVA